MQRGVIFHRSPPGLKPVAMTACLLWLAGKRALVVDSDTQCCSVVTGGDNVALSPKCVWLSPHRQAQCLKTHTHTDLWENWPCRHTEAPILPPWWGCPTRARAKEHGLPLWAEHLWPPPMHKHNYNVRFAHEKYNSTKKTIFSSVCVQGIHFCLVWYNHQG